MKNDAELSPEERKRLFAELRQNPEYVKTRRLLLILSIGNILFLAVMSLLMMNDIAPLWVTGSAMAVFLVASQIFISRLSRKQNAMMNSLKQEYALQEQEKTERGSKKDRAREKRLAKQNRSGSQEEDSAGAE